jgi:NADPH-dependent 2,4-dienoyl-CoA reductase/sulfur reductase-like enzyme/nitrite reductase/ring-hydroxylating ferredoxin subunit
LLLGQAAGEAVLLVRRGDEVYAVAAACGHYGAPLADGIVVGCQLRCPWHHARFDARTGDAEGPPSTREIASWDVVREGARVYLGKRRGVPSSQKLGGGPASVVIVGAGAAGDAACATLRSGGYAGPITLIGRDAEPFPVDRPNLSKDYLAGTAQEDWLWLRDSGFYAEREITLLTGVSVTRFRPDSHRVWLADGRSLEYGALILATGAAPVRLEIPGSDLPHVFTLRTLSDSRSIAAHAAAGKSVAVIGASFIGLETAASLRQREMAVHVVAPDSRPLQRVLGPELGDFVRALHEEHGVRFHLSRKPAAISASEVLLDDGTKIGADLVVMGVGVRPLTALAEEAGLRVDRGIVVDEFLRTSAHDVWAAGDVARYPAEGGSRRIEHWVVGQQQGQTAARNILGKSEAFRAVPFFWSQHYDVPINYVGHAEKWDTINVSGSIPGRDAVVSYRSGGRITAVATIYRDRESLLAEEAFARDDQDTLEKLCKPPGG